MVLRISILSFLGLGLLPAGPQENYDKDIQPLLETYCYDCHGDGTAKGKFSMDTFKDLPAHLHDQKHWLAIWRNVRSQIMPPSDKDQLAHHEKKQILAWIQKDVFQLDPNNPDPGAVTIRRLNRTEYQNAVYDLLGVEFDTTEAFPPDDTGYGFDNIGDVLSLSPLLMEKYIAAADQVVSLALPKGAAAQVPRVDMEGGTFVDTGNPRLTGRWLPFKDKHTVQAEQEIKWAGNYQVTVAYAIRGAAEATEHEADLTVKCGGTPLGSEVLGWDQRKTIPLTGKVPLKEGRQRFEISLSPRQAPAAGEEELALTIQRVIIQGPLGGKQKEYSKGYQMIFVDGPAPDDEKDKANYARKIMRSFVSRAFRRPIENATIERLLAIVESVDKRPGKSFEDGIKEAIATCLCSPRFLYRVEIQPEPNNPDKIVRIDDYALAARLSFFLWGSVPDDELLSLAFNKRLRPELHAQIDRMLADPRSNRLTENFVGQWLQTRDLESLPVQAQEILGLPTKREASLAFDVRLREDMKKETNMLFDFILRKGRPAEELISARYTFLNERLAKYYGIGGVVGEEFVPVDLTEHPERGGILTHGSYLIVSSNPTRTSPVKRGLFVLDNLLGSPAPPAPADVPQLEEAAKATGGTPTMREMMVEHRKNPDCKACHARMDPIGLGLENFNALGQFRTRDQGKPIDASGVLLTGEKFDNVAELKEILGGRRKEDFYRCLAEKMLTFAIGRGVEYYDAPTIDQLVARLEDKDGNLKELLLGIIESAPFQKRRGSE